MTAAQFLRLLRVRALKKHVIWPYCDHRCNVPRNDNGARWGEGEYERLVRVRLNRVGSP